ncbi:MAG: hypothetical protein GY746_12430, partial [Gammaproteobacteria bacterium]|nr:hypothetical protein [Gammaproteobacteria bacterium]
NTGDEDYSSTDILTNQDDVLYGNDNNRPDISTDNNIDEWQADKNGDTTNDEDKDAYIHEEEEELIDLSPEFSDPGLDSDGDYGSRTPLAEKEAEEELPEIEVALCETQASAQTMEDQPVSIDISAMNPDPSNEMIVMLSGFPEGTTFSKGSASGGGWIITDNDFSNLMLYPALHCGDDFQLHVNAIVKDSSGREETTVTSIDVKVEAVADTPDLEVIDIEGMEDIGIASGIRGILEDTDGSEMIRIEIDGLPAGAGFSHGYIGADGLLHVRGDDIAKLDISSPPHSDDEFSLTVNVYSVEQENGDEAAGVSRSFNVTVHPVADAPELTTVNLIGDEDELIALDIDARLVDEDGSEDMVVFIEGVPDGAIICNGAAPLDAARIVEPGVWAATQAEVANLFIQAPPNSDADFQLKIHAVTIDTEKDPSQPEYSIIESTSVLNVEVNAAVDPVELTINAVSGEENHFIPLDINMDVIDTDGSESLAIKIEGLPTGAMLTAGVEETPGVWTVTQDQLT